MGRSHVGTVRHVSLVLSVCAAAAVAACPTLASAGDIVAEGCGVSALTERSEIDSPNVAAFDEATSGSLPSADMYAGVGLTWVEGPLVDALPGVTTGGVAGLGSYTGLAGFPDPIAGGAIAEVAGCSTCGVATFSVPVTRFGLTAATNGTQFVTAWDAAGEIIGQVTWIPSADSAFVGIDTGGRSIAMIAYGNRDLLSGSNYATNGFVTISDTWVWNACNNDGVLDFDEECDDGNTDAGDGCSPACTIETCGNCFAEGTEVCDDGNTVDGDGCSANCASDETCGNGVVDPVNGEECDDGNLLDGDFCRPDCRLARCGDGVVDAVLNEVCDDGNNTNGDGCSADCLSAETCGNGVVDVSTGEACDDGNQADGDGCQATCALPTCGDGILDSAEVCDDGNFASGDGCNATCTSDETCGNAVVDGPVGEQCDDGNLDAGDGCADNCRIEFCGNGQLDPGEACDDDNQLDGDGCSAECVVEDEDESDSDTSGAGDSGTDGDDATTGGADDSGGVVTSGSASASGSDGGEASTSTTTSTESPTTGSSSDGSSSDGSPGSGTLDDDGLGCATGVRAPHWAWTLLLLVAVRRRRVSSNEGSAPQ